MRYPADQEENTRQRVLNEALQILREGGPNRLGVNDVMKRAGLTHGAFYVTSSPPTTCCWPLSRPCSPQRAPSWRALRATPIRPQGWAPLSIGIRRPSTATLKTPAVRAPLASDVPRLDPAPHERYAAAVAHLVAALADRLRPDPNAAAATALQQMVGAVGFARALGPTAPSDDGLRLAKTAVYAHLGLDEGGQT